MDDYQRGPPGIVAWYAAAAASLCAFGRVCASYFGVLCMIMDRLC